MAHKLEIRDFDHWIYKACKIMDVRKISCFKVGELAESRSFKKGFRGAWFRCKIKNTFKREFSLDFYDFPEEKVRWTRLYQKPQMGSNLKPELMIRPQYPPLYNESEVPDANKISEVIVVRNDVWKVRDEVDWYADGCYWSGSVTKILTKEIVEIMLLSPPAGEGLIYEVSCVDLRPSLDWSLEHGWTFPISKGGENIRPCARLIKPVNEVASGISETNAVYKRESFDSSFSSETSSSLPLANVGPITNDDVVNSGVPTKRKRTGGSRSDTLEGTVLELEELVNKVKWLKGILQYGNLSKAKRPPWKFLAHGSS